MRKKIVASCLALFCFASITVALAADIVKSDMTVIQNGTASQLTSTSYLVDSSLYAPYATVAKELGAEAQWDETAQTLALTKGGNSIELTEDSSTPLRLIDGQAYVPVRFVYETFGYEVGYEEKTRTVRLIPDEQAAKPVEASGQEVSFVADLDPAQATGMRTEGLIGDKQGRLYTADQESKRLLRVLPDTGEVEELTVLPRATTGMAFDQAGNLYLASGGGEGVEGAVLRVPAKALEAGAFDPSLVETFVTGVNGANGLVFDGNGNLYVSGAATGNVYVVTPTGELTVWASGIKPERDVQPITVNGIAFDQENRLYIANTSSGVIHRVQVNKDGTFGQVEQFAKDARLIGADGIVFGPEGDLFVAANERNAIVKVSPQGSVTEVAANDNQGPLEFPASVHLVGDTLYVSNFDQPRGVNKENQPGIGASIVKLEVGSK